MARRIKTNTLMAREGAIRGGRTRGSGGRFVKSTFGSGRFSGLSEKGKAILAKRDTKFRAQVQVRFEDQHEKVLAKMEKNNTYSLRGAMYVVSQMAKARIVRAKKSSRPGGSPHTRGKAGKNLKGAIRYHYDKSKPEAYIGPTYELLGDVGGLHERGGDRPSTPKVENYPARPFMQPALEESLDRFVGQFRGSLNR